MDSKVRWEYCSCPESIEVEGEWTQWTNWSICSASCGGGIRVRERDCEESEDGSGEEEDDVIFVCDGLGDQQEECNTDSCSAWGEWGEWSMCNSECGGGTRTRSRDCQNAGAHLSYVQRMLYKLIGRADLADCDGDSENPTNQQTED